MRKRLYTIPAAFVALSLGLAACGGGGGGAAPGAASNPVPSGASQKLGITVTGVAPALRKAAGAVRPQASSSPSSAAAVTVTYNGATVATGSLDTNGFAELVFTQAVPAGATVTVTIATTPPIVATTTLATAIPATAVEITYTSGSNPTITVTSAADENGDGHVDSSDPEQQTATENPGNGDDESVDSNGGDLPSTLPVTISVCASTITIAPAAGAPSGLGLHFEEKVHDGDAHAQFDYQTNAFTAPLNFPYLSSAARMHLVVTHDGAALVEIEAPIGSVTGSNGSSPSPSPSACASAMPTTSPSPEPSESASPGASASPSTSPSPTASASPSASPVASATP